MRKLKELFYKYYELITYVFFGGITTLVDFVIYYALLWAFGEDIYILASVAAWAGAVLVAYVTNKTLVFRDKTEGAVAIFWQTVRFVLSRVLTLGVQTALMWLFVDVIEMSEWLVKLPVAVVIVILNYVASKIMVFTKKKDDTNGENAKM
jgi:putative flippase GtrA